MEQIVAVILLLIIIVFIFKKLKKQPDTELNEHQKKIIKIGDDVVDTFQTSYKKIKKKSEIIISKSYLTGCNWYLENDLDEDIIYTFRNNDEILITKNGIVERRKYECLEFPVLGRTAARGCNRPDHQRHRDTHAVPSASSGLFCRVSAAVHAGAYPEGTGAYRGLGRKGLFGGAV